MARKQTAEQIAETAMDLIEQLKATAIAETRSDFAAAFAKLATAAERTVRNHQDKDKRPVTDDFRAGLAFAAELLAADDFDA